MSSQLDFGKQSDAATPNSGKVAIFASDGGNLATKDAGGNVREYSPTPLESEGMIYGVRWDSVNDTMQPGIVNGGSFVATDYANYPVQEQMGRGLLTGGGSWTKLNQYSSDKLPDGTSATIDGSSGQVMVYVPRHYQLVTTSGDYKYILISEQPFSFNGVDAWVPPAFLDKQGFYVSAFQGVAATDSTSADVYSAVIDTSGYSTNTNPNPYTNQTRGDFRTYCSNTGAVFCQWSYGMQEVLRILFVTEFKTWNSQAVLPGYTERSSWDYSYTSQAGETLGLGDYSGSIYDDDLDLYIANSYRGIENPFGNVRQWLDGINIDTNDSSSTQQRVWIAFDPSNFADDTTTDYIDTGIAPGFDDDDDYQKDIYGQEKYAPLWPTGLGDGADSDSYLTDYMYNDPLGSGWRVVTCSGRLILGGSAGFGFIHASTGSGFSYTKIGSRLGAYV